MKRRYSLTVTVTADATSEAEALKLLEQQLRQYTPQEKDITLEGYVHPGGQVLPCPLPPEGFRLEIARNWDEDADIGLALPAEQPLPDGFYLSYELNQWEWHKKLPPGTLIWHDAFQGEYRWQTTTELLSSLADDEEGMEDEE